MKRRRTVAKMNIYTLYSVRNGRRTHFALLWYNRKGASLAIQ